MYLRKKDTCYFFVENMGALFYETLKFNDFNLRRNDIQLAAAFMTKSFALFTKVIALFFLLWGYPVLPHHGLNRQAAFSWQVFSVRGLRGFVYCKAEEAAIMEPPEY